MGLRQRGILARSRRARRTAAPRRHPSPRPRRSTPCSRRSRRSSSSTTTRPPSCCCTASAGRWRRRRPTTSSTRRWSAMTRIPPSRATTPTSRPSSTRPTATPTRTRRRRTARSASLPRWATCESASEPSPTTSGIAADCESGFNFPDDEALIQAEFEKNIPFALAVAESAKDPNDPVSVVGPRCRGLPRRLVLRLVRRPADRGGLGQARHAAEGHELPDQRRPHEDRTRQGVEGRRALRRRERRLLRRVPRHGDGNEGRRQRRGLVLGPPVGARHHPEPQDHEDRERALHLSRSHRTPATRCSSSPTRTTRA